MGKSLEELEKLKAELEVKLEEQEFVSADNQKRVQLAQDIRDLRRKTSKLGQFAQKIKPVGKQLKSDLSGIGRGLQGVADLCARIEPPKSKKSKKSKKKQSDNMFDFGGF